MTPLARLPSAVGIGTVRLRLTLWCVGVLALVLAGFGTGLWCTAKVRILSAVDRELDDRARYQMFHWQYMAHMMGPYRMPPQPPPNLPAPPGGQPDGLYRLHPRWLGLPGGRAASPGSVPYDPVAWRVAARGREVRTTAQVPGEPEPVRVLSVPLWGGRTIRGVLQVAVPLAEMNRDLRGLSWTLLTLIPLALIAAGIGGAFLTESALRPVRALAEAVEQIEARDLSQRLTVVGHDEFSHLALTFNAMLARLERAFEQQQRFVADASHELRSPLTLIQGYTSMALSRPRAAEDYRTALEATDKAARRMNKVVQDLLLLARSDAGQLELRRRPVLLRSVLDQARESVPIRPPETISRTLSDDGLLVLGDESHLVRLFTNLLENAARHTPADGSITLDAAPKKDSVVVTVQDTGSGISPEHLPHILEPFYRVDSARARQQGGTGLGLAICKSIVEAHHGCLRLESALGEGTTVRVTLPRAQAVALPGAVAESHAPAPTVAR